ncbi:MULTISPECIES: restriction endonuclease subunit S [Bacteroides]|jgi:type I restriction enzyme S subunit|uniref:restriction endonuclease subunit S n=4 Tax=Bacteroidales TaxID=171549 RepID=UPI00157CEB87|nr:MULTISPECIES: restriction endonuclease subunit S [Bacteroides]MBV4282227.1 restriction endonuclease subunit S [Bacteroides uniformis]
MDTKKLRQKILDLAIRGKLVPQDPNDEPASVLLERIKAEKERLIKEGKIKRSKKTNNASDTPHYENVPFEVPKGWVWTTLGSISNYGTSINVQVGDIDSNEWILELEDIEKDTAKIIQHLSKKERFLNGTRHKFQKGDILYSKLRTYLNKVLVASNGGFCSTEIMPFGTYGVLSNEYICHVLRSNHFLDYTLRCGYGVKMPRLSTNDACKGMIPLPPLAEQQRIVTEIEKWFSLIDQIEQGKDDLHSIVKQTKSKILDLAIHGELVPQDPNDEPAIELLKRINPSFTPCDNGHYPVGWIDVILGDIFYHNTGKALNSSNKEGVLRNYLTTSNVYWNQFDLSLVKQMPFRDNELEKCTVQKGDLLVCEGGDVGRSAIWNFDYNICIQNHIHRLRPKGDLNVSFYYYVLRFLKKHNRIGGKGIGLLGLSSNELHKIGMPLPPRKEQDRIVLKIEELFSVLDNIQNALEA